MNHKIYIGLEVHIELKTKSKMFCQCFADYFSREPNTLCCPVCLGLPGAFPVPNKEAIDRLLMVGLAFNCKINLQSSFDRKNYSYPDLPKGYQISQHYQPFCYDGFLDINITGKDSCHSGKSRLSRDASRNLSNRFQVKSFDKAQNLPGITKEKKRIRIREIHLEEDTGKLLHSSNSTLIDFNRSGVPLMEIVTEPDLETSEEVKEYLKKIQQIVRYLEVSDCDMEKGSMRCEPSISLKIKDPLQGKQRSKIKTINQNSKTIELQELEELPNYRVEIKNINSFRFAQKAVDYEIERQRKILESGQKVIQETRGWSESKNATVSQRTKEVAKDYRYFPEPDIPPVKLRDEDIKILSAKIPELPDEKIARFMKEYKLNEYDSRILCEDKWLAEYYEEAVKTFNNKHLTFNNINKTIANLIINKKVDVYKNNPGQLVKIILSQQNKKTISDEELKKIIKKVIVDNQKPVNDYKNGKQASLMFLVGQVMRETKGQAEAGKVKELLANQL